jgi:antitoxin PrlF
MRVFMKAESTLTDRYQTTVPEAVRRALGLAKRDRIQYAIGANGEVVLSRAPEFEQADPAIEKFLAFLADDMTRHPERLRPLDRAFAERVRALVEGVEFDMDVPLPEDE